MQAAINCQKVLHCRHNTDILFAEMMNKEGISFFLKPITVYILQKVEHVPLCQFLGGITGGVIQRRQIYEKNGQESCVFVSSREVFLCKSY